MEPQRNAKCLLRLMLAPLIALALALTGATPAVAYEQREAIVSSGHGWSQPGYLVVHETANPGASAANHVTYWRNNQPNVTMAHYVMELDGSVVYHTQRDDTIAWHVGNGNYATVGIELAHATNSADAARQFDEAAQWCADYLSVRGWGIDRLLSHSECRWIWGGTDHTDPDGYFAKYGRSWAQFEGLVSSKMGGGIGGQTGGSGTGSMSGTSNGAPTANTTTVDVHYALHVRGGGWWPEVENYGEGEQGYAGAPFTRHDMLIAWADRGTLRYRVHTLEDGWLDWVQAASYTDSVNGMAGIWGHTIDGVQMYYVTPEGEEYSQVYYRSQTVDREGYLESVCDDGTTYGGDDYAGIYGEPLDRLQMAISDGDVF